MRCNGDRIYALLTVALLSIGCASGKKDNAKNESIVVDNHVDYRLPLAIRPTSYTIILEIPTNLNDTDFSGTVSIHATVIDKTDEIVFHVGNMTVKSISIARGKDPLPIGESRYDSVTEKYTVKLNETLPTQTNITLAIVYKGRIRDDMIGLYRSSYIDGNGQTKWLLATQFEAVHARHAFPCFDEPGFKATFAIRIKRPSKYNCLSNMNKTSDVKLASGKESWAAFNTSVTMSTYLVAFVISDFDNRQNSAGNFTVWAQPNAIEQTNYALSLGPKILKYLSEHWNEPYQLTKMDMIAIPDFQAGAMENWGLIAYRGTRMLYDDRESSATAQQVVARTIVHECVHSWFGNLVTPDWWSNLWLSEGFARYYEYMATDKLEPSWKLRQQFVVEQIQTVFALDAVDSSKPMTTNISSQKEIAAVANPIAYAKAASVIRMMELSFGSETFDSSLRYYLKAHNFSSANPDDLWSAFQRKIDENGPPLGATVKTIMNTWTTQPGYPVLSVKIANDSVQLRQKRFLLRNSDSIDNKNLTWWIPVTWTSKKNLNFTSTIPKYWLGNETSKIDLKVDSDDWIIFNIQSAGYYRVDYDEQSWYRIFSILKSKNYNDIHEINRAAIVDDLLNLARSGLVDYKLAMDGLSYIKLETNYLPFKALFSGLSYLNKRFDGQSTYDYISNFSLSMINRIYEDLGFDDRPNDDRFVILLRNELNEWACSFDHEKCVIKSLTYFKKWQHENGTIPKNQRPAVYCTAMRHGDLKDWEFLWQRYSKSNSTAEQTVILNALGCSKNSEILDKYLLLAVTDFEKSLIRKHDSKMVFNSVIQSGQFGARHILQFVDKHHAIMDKHFGGYDEVAKILSTASERFSTKKTIEDYENFIEKHAIEFKTISESLKKSLDLAYHELKWFETNEKSIISWMKKNVREPPTTPSIPTVVPPVSTANKTYSRLPRNILPRSYDILLTPRLCEATFMFDGRVEIVADVVKATNEIVLNYNNLRYIDSSVVADGRLIEVKSAGQILNEHHILYLTETLSVNTTIIITIDYIGTSDNVFDGFFSSSYVNKEAHDTRPFAATHLEPIGARKMFFCFDEPVFKATFVISVNRPSTYRAISNMPLNTSQIGINGRILDTFERTPVMSTYLVALIVSDLAFYENKNENYRVWTRPNAINHSHYALSMMSPLVKHFEKALSLPYQLPKMDMVALPGISADSMGNWGLLTYEETNLLYDSQRSPITTKQNIANVISREIARQWFVNEVTPYWWKFVWLSEGFATYFEFHGTARLEPKWGLESQFVVDRLHSALQSDSLPTTHPMNHNVRSYSEIAEIFDQISRSKAASILRMLEKLFGSRFFYDALHDYIVSRSGMSVVPNHLYKALQIQIDKNGVELNASIETIMDTWTNQSGYPVVNVTIINGIATVSQERYLSKNPENLSINNVWWIPINWATKSNPDFSNTTAKYWLNTQKASINLTERVDDWVIVNVQQTGFYRVNYDTASWNKIINALKLDDRTIIHEVNRASLLADLLDFGRSGRVDYGTVLSATQYLINETNYIPWRAAFDGLTLVNDLLEGTHIYELYRTHVVTILSQIYKKLGLEEIDGEPHYDKLLRRYVVKWACDFGLEDCISKSLRYFADWKSNSSQLIPVDIRDTVYRTAIKYGSIDDWMFMGPRYESSDFPEERIMMLNALGCINDTQYLESLLSKAITGESNNPRKKSAEMFSAVYNSGQLGVKSAVRFLVRNIDKTVDYQAVKHVRINYGVNKSAWEVAAKPSIETENIVKEIHKRLRNETIIRAFEKWVNQLQKLEPILKSPLNTIRHSENLEWYEKYGPTIFEWLDTNYPSEDYRLPKKIKPIAYDIYLTPYLNDGNFTFDGEIKMDLEVMEDTSSIVMLANELKINNLIAYVNSVNSLTISSYNVNKTTHRLTIYLTTIVKAGSKLSIHVNYTGILNDKMHGFYRSSYVDENGNKKWLATTQFQPVYARQAFPCFDEPGFKAKFKIHIQRPNEYRTLSNMPWSVSVASDKKNWTWDSYEETLPMSSYSVAFVVSEFEVVKNEKGDFGVWGRPAIVENGVYALNLSQTAMKFFENYTGIEYPLKKIDLVGVPDFELGGMENWGLVTFRENTLLYNENVTSVMSKRYVTTSVVHEISHMWIGNLVTCDWWDHLWLQEGFATYFPYIILDSIEPDWKISQQFPVYELQVAMQLDAKPKIHPLNNNVKEPKSIQNSFDRIAYTKAASVIRMMHHAFGNEIFVPALRNYLNDNKYGNVNPDDLWSAINIQANASNTLTDVNATVKMIMDTWTDRSGYPVVNVTWNSGLLTLGQQRFVISDTSTFDRTNENPFWIPITITTRTQSNFANTRPIFWFGTTLRQHPLALKTDEWFVINIRETGYYRVNYDKTSWMRLIDGLGMKNFSGIHEMNRAQIIDDILNLARADYVNYNLALRATTYLVDEKNHLPWKAFFNALNYLDQRFAGHDVAEELSAYVLELTKKIYETVIAVDEKNNSHQLDELNRQLILSWMCKFEHVECVESSRKAFDEWRRNGDNSRIPPNDRPFVYCTSIRKGNDTDWEFLWNEYERTNFASEKITILAALGCSKNITTLNGYMRRVIFDDKAIRRQDLGKTFAALCGMDKFALDAAIDFLVANYAEIQKRFGGHDEVAVFFSVVAGKISTQEQIDKLESLANQTMTKNVEISKSLQESVKVAKANLQWFKSHSNVIHLWLTSRYPNEKPGDGGSGGGSGSSIASGIASPIYCLVLAQLYVLIDYYRR